jgi:dCMP deaminase
METAKIWANESYCKRMKVGAVLAKDGRILATGYNGTIHGAENICECYEKFESAKEAEEALKTKNSIKCPDCKGSGDISLRGTPYYEPCFKCDGAGILRHIDKTNEFTVHAEQNVIAFCAKNGIPTKDTVLYITLSPCKNCAKLIIQAGIKEIVYSEDYRDSDGIDFLSQNGIKVTKL